MRLHALFGVGAWLCLAGCAAPRPQDDDPRVGSGGATSSAGSGEASSGTGPSLPGTLGVVIVDAQETFVASASNPDMPAVIDRTKNTLAGSHGVPVFVTFEASQQGDHALHAPLAPAVPPHAQDFVKTKFDATGLPAFRQALEAAELSHVAVLGAETDVCVLQTVLGLRAMGLSVLLQADAVFSEETNTSPALRRMQQAGVHLLSVDDVAHFLATPRALPSPGDVGIRIIRPLEIGVVLHAFTQTSVGQSADPLGTQKSARLRELLLVSEWFELPVYAAADLPSAYAEYYAGELRPLSRIAGDGVTQLVFAGTDGGLADAIGARAGSHEVFVMEDALLAMSTPAELDPLFASGLVPITYKSFYYEMTKSVDLAEWPSQAWVERFDEYYWITSAPEDLPPIPP